MTTVAAIILCDVIDGDFINLQSFLVQTLGDQSDIYIRVGTVKEQSTYSFIKIGLKTRVIINSSTEIISAHTFYLL